MWTRATIRFRNRWYSTVSKSHSGIVPGGGQAGGHCAHISNIPVLGKSHSKRDRGSQNERLIVTGCGQSANTATIAGRCSRLPESKIPRMTTSPSGFSRSEPTLPRKTFGAMPIEQGWGPGSTLKHNQDFRISEMMPQLPDQRGPKDDLDGRRTAPTHLRVKPSARCGGQPPRPHTHWRTRSYAEGGLETLCDIGERNGSYFVIVSEGLFF